MHTVRNLILLALAGVGAFGIATPALAQDVVSLERETTVVGLYVPGTSFEVTVTIDIETDGTVTTLGLEENLPTGWTFEGSTGGVTPFIAPDPGKDGLLEFAWFPVPSFPFSYTYQVGIPQEASGLRTLQGEVIARILPEGAAQSEEVRSPNEVTVLRDTEGAGLHSADTSEDNLFSLSELLRGIQLFNIGAYHCATVANPSEDGYRPGSEGPRDCVPHNSDYNPQNWSISLSELLRLIQLFNSGGYRECLEQNTEDGFCPGLPTEL